MALRLGDVAGKRVVLGLQGRAVPAQRLDLAEPGDPSGELEEMLDEIEIRAAVELAKLEHSAGSR